MTQILRLTWPQMMQGAHVGIMRQVSNLKAGREPRNGAEAKLDWQRHIEGALGEMAVADHYGLFWDGRLHDLHAADVGSLEVRTRSEDWHDLILQADDSKDKPESRFILLTGLNGVYTMRGWCYGHEGKIAPNWKDPAGGRAAFFVPQTALRPIEELSVVMRITEPAGSPC